MEKTLDIKGIDLAALFGAADAHLRLIEGSFAVNVVVRNDNIKLKGDDIQLSDKHQLKQSLHYSGGQQILDVISPPNQY